MSDEKDSKNVVSLTDFKSKKQIKDQLSQGRNPLFASHLDGKVTGSPHFKRPVAEDFGDRVQRIRTSIEKINKLLGDLKKISNDESKRDDLDKKKPTSLFLKQ